MRFAIYIPGNGIVDEKKLRDVGLPLLASGVSGIPTPAGPDGKQGVVFSWPTSDPRSTIAYMPDLQTWIPATAAGTLATGRYWVGFTNGSPPTPSDLAWNQQHNGKRLVLGDGQSWLIPEAGNLPRDCKRSDDGKWTYEINEKFREYWEESCQWYLDLIDCVVREDGLLEIAASCCDYLVKALSLNYRITPEVVSHLNLFNTLTIGPALRITISGITIREELDQKKTDDTQPDT